MSHQLSLITNHVATIESVAAYVCRSREEFIDHFNARMLAHSLWQHEFFKRLSDGISKSDLQNWTIHGGQIEEAFPKILRKISQNQSLSPAARGVFLGQLDDEVGNGNPQLAHFQLYKQFLATINVSWDQYQSAGSLPGTESVINTLLAGADHQNQLCALSLMASEESIISIEFPIIMDEIRRLFMVEDHDYFKVHIDIDQHHSRELLDLCYDEAKSTHDFNEIFRWQKNDLDNNLRFYDSLMELLSA